jgi:uncharacterized membrane protein HdeD (DUF308 family)
LSDSAGVNRGAGCADTGVSDRRSKTGLSQNPARLGDGIDLHQSRPVLSLDIFDQSTRRPIMSHIAGTHLSTNGGTELAPLRAKSGWIIALGVVYVLAGLVALGSVVFATVVTVFVVGIMMLIAGVAEVINSFQIKSWGKFLLWLLLGVLYILAGFVTFENPLLAAAVLTLMLGFALIVSGIMRLILAFNMKQEMPWVWVALSGVITLLLGLIIVAHWPVSGLYILGLFLGIDLVIAGAGWIGIGFGLRRQA